MGSSCRRFRNALLKASTLRRSLVAWARRYLRLARLRRRFSSRLSFAGDTAATSLFRGGGGKGALKRQIYKRALLQRKREAQMFSNIPTALEAFQISKVPLVPRKWNSAVCLEKHSRLRILNVPSTHTDRVCQSEVPQSISMNQRCTEHFTVCVRFSTHRS